jgi:hypothetical protein
VPVGDGGVGAELALDLAYPLELQLVLVLAVVVDPVQQRDGGEHGGGQQYRAVVVPGFLQGLQPQVRAGRGCLLREGHARLDPGHVRPVLVIRNPAVPDLGLDVVQAAGDEERRGMLGAVLLAQQVHRDIRVGGGVLLVDIRALGVLARVPAGGQLFAPRHVEELRPVRRLPRGPAVVDVVKVAAAYVGDVGAGPGPPVVVGLGGVRVADRVAVRVGLGVQVPPPRAGARLPGPVVAGLPQLGGDDRLGPVRVVVVPEPVPVAVRGGHGPVLAVPVMVRAVGAQVDLPALVVLGMPGPARVVADQAGRLPVHRQDILSVSRVAGRGVPAVIPGRGASGVDPLDVRSGQVPADPGPPGLGVGRRGQPVHAGRVVIEVQVRCMPDRGHRQRDRIVIGEIPGLEADIPRLGRPQVRCPVRPGRPPGRGGHEHVHRGLAGPVLRGGVHGGGQGAVSGVISTVQVDGGGAGGGLRAGQRAGGQLSQDETVSEVPAIGVREPGVVRGHLDRFRAGAAVGAGDQERDPLPAQGLHAVLPEFIDPDLCLPAGSRGT